MLRRLVFPIFLVCTLLIPVAEATEHPQDFSGIWLAYVMKDTNPGFANNRLTPEGETLGCAFNTRYRVGYCLSFGPSAVMPSIDGNPLEIIHSDQRIMMVAERRQIRRIHESNNCQVSTRLRATHS